MAAYAIFFIFLSICGVGLYSIVFNSVVDEINTIMNTYISAGMLSTEFMGYWNFAIGVLVALPLLCLIAITIWAIVRAIEKRTGMV